MSAWHKLRRGFVEEWERLRPGFCYGSLVGSHFMAVWLVVTAAFVRDAEILALTLTAVIFFWVGRWVEKDEPWK